MSTPTPLKRAIFESQRTQREIAAALGMDAGHLSRIVNGLRVSASVQAKIAAVLGRPVDELFPGDVSVIGTDDPEAEVA